MLFLFREKMHSCSCMQLDANFDCTLLGNPPVQDFVLGCSSAKLLGNMCGISPLADGIVVAELNSE